MNDSDNEPGKSYYKSVGEIQSLAQRFETCVLTPSDMTHAAHLAIGVWYLSRMSASEAAERIRGNLRRFISRNGLKGYNETITLFWIKLISGSLENAERSRSIKEIANDLIGQFGNSQIIFDYYSRERLLSKEARASWVEPDLKPLDF